MVLLLGMFWTTVADAQEGQEASPAQGLSGITVVFPGGEVQIYSVELEDNTVGLDDVDLGFPGTNNGIRLIINDLTATTGFLSTDVTELRLYRSTDAVFDVGDILVASSGALSPLGAATLFDATGAGANRRIAVVFASTFFVATAVISATAASGHAFTIGALNPHIGLEELLFGLSSEVGSAIIASDANHVSIGSAAKKASRGGVAIPFGGESVMACVLLGAGVFALWRRA